MPRSVAGAPGGVEPHVAAAAGRPLRRQRCWRVARGSEATQPAGHWPGSWHSCRVCRAVTELCARCAAGTGRCALPGSVALAKAAWPPRPPCPSGSERMRPRCPSGRWRRRRLPGRGCSSLACTSARRGTDALVRTVPNPYELPTAMFIIRWFWPHAVGLSPLARRWPLHPVDIVGDHGGTVPQGIFGEHSARDQRGGAVTARAAHLAVSRRNRMRGDGG